MNTLEIPKDGLEGLKQNWRSDALSGFLVFLLALPLSLGIAKASGFPAAMGVLTAMIGGLVVGIFQGGRLTIKGPAAGLITVCAGAVTDLGALNLEGQSAVHLACGAILIMSIIQIVFGFLKFGDYSDFFPLSAVHGMLAAIGILIFAKQFPILLGVDPALTKGLSPVQLYTHIPQFISNATPNIAIVGLLSLVIIFGLPQLGGLFKKVPAPMVVLVVAIPLAMFLDFKNVNPGSLVVIGDFWKNVTPSVSFAAINTFVFWKYVFMFLFVNSLESLLTVKAVDGLDPFKRKSDYNKDLRALAVGNGLSGFFGGLPMISEVARSSANVGFGARTRWANFFHGGFLLIAMLVMIPFIEMIPNAALAAMLIAVAYRLASPKEFIGTYKIGPEQLAIFLTTIAVTVAEDLLLGVAAGIIIKIIFHLVNGASLSNLFKANYTMAEDTKGYTINVFGVATFSNFLGYKKLWSKLEPKKDIVMNFSEAKLVDHSFMDQLHHLEEDKHAAGSHISLVGLDKFNPLSSHPMAARKVGSTQNKIEVRLTTRQIMLRKFADENDYDFNPQHVRTSAKYKDFPIQKGNKIRFEENLMTKYLDLGKVEVADMTLIQGAALLNNEVHVTVVHLSETELPIPDFALEPEKFGSRFSELVSGKDIDFEEFPGFSKRFYLRGDELKVRAFFSEPIIRFLETHEDIHVECHRHRLLLYRKLNLLDTSEIIFLEKFAEEFVQAVKMTLEKQVAH